MSESGWKQTEEERVEVEVAEAREDMAEGLLDEALADLDRAMRHTDDPEKIKEVYELTVRAYAKASFMERINSGGHSILEAAEQKLQQTQA